MMNSRQWFDTSHKERLTLGQVHGRINRRLKPKFSLAMQFNINTTTLKLT